MAIGHLLAALGGLVLALPVNYLADWLPVLRTASEDKVTLPDGPPVSEVSEAGASPTRPRVVRYAIVELLLAAFCAYLWGQAGLTAHFFILVVYVALFMLIGVIDIEHRLVLNAVMFPAFALAVLEVLISHRQPVLEAFAGYAIAQIVVMGFYLFGAAYLWIVNTLRSRPINEVAFGFGDVTLATFCGLVVGYPRVVLMLVLMVLLGGLLAVLYVVARMALGRRYHVHMALPYGPAILVAATLMLVWGEAMARLFGAD